MTSASNTRALERADLRLPRETSFRHLRRDPSAPVSPRPPTEADKPQSRLPDTSRTADTVDLDRSFSANYREPQ